MTTRPQPEVQARVEAAGVATEVGPVARDGAPGAMTPICFRDPDGNLVEIAGYAADAG